MNTAFVIYLTYVTVCVAVMQAAEREMEAARIRAVEMIAMAEAVGAQRVAASAASVNKMFDEHHPELAAAHPVLDSTGSPMPRAVSVRALTATARVHVRRRIRVRRRRVYFTASSTFRVWLLDRAGFVSIPRPPCSSAITPVRHMYT